MSSTALLIAVFSGAFLSIGAQSWGAESREVIMQRLPADEYAAVNVRTMNGNVRITGVSGSDSITVVAVKTARADRLGAAREAVDRLRVVVAADGRTLTVRADDARAGSLVRWMTGRGAEYRVDFVVTVPSSYDADGRSTNGNVRVASVQACQAHTTNGNVDVDSTSGPVDIRTTNGQIRARVFGEAKGVAVSSSNGNVSFTVAGSLREGLEVSTTNGNVTLHIPAGLDADLSCQTRAGSVSTDGIVLHGLREERTSLTGRAGQGGVPITLKTRSGTITVEGH